MQRSPRLWGLARSRWWLAGFRQSVTWLAEMSLTGIWQLLRRLRIVYRRGRRYVHSPDPTYNQKLARLARVRAQVRANPRQFVLVYEDELTFYRRPTVAPGYTPVEADAPRARQGLRYNTAARIAGSLDLMTGQVFYWQRAHFTRPTLIAYYRALAAHYPKAQKIFVVQDNWPVHFHDDILQAVAQTKIVLVPLPTYAPWTNPIEKLWRKLYQEVLHLHEFGDDWETTKQVVTTWLNQFRRRSPELLRYVGLYPN